ncbi:UNVERIFIED_ORG: hypothetical protein GGI61_004688 [Rhizobium esperanzae]
MGHPNQTSSVTPLRAMSRAVSFAAFGCLLLGQTPAFAQSASQQPASATNTRTTNNAAPGFDEETDASTAPAANGAAATADEAQRPAIADAQTGDEITGSILDENMRRLNTREARIDETLPGRRAAESASTAKRRAFRSALSCSVRASPRASTPRPPRTATPGSGAPFSKPMRQQR